MEKKKVEPQGGANTQEVTNAIQLGGRGRVSISSYVRRKECIMRKTTELKMLSGVEGCTIILDPHGDGVNTIPEKIEEVTALLKKFVDYCKDENNKKNLSNAEILEDEKLSEEFCKKKDNFIKNFLECKDIQDSWIHELSRDSLKDFSKMVEFKIEDVTKRLKLLNQAKNSNQLVALESGQDFSKMVAVLEQDQQQQLLLPQFPPCSWFDINDDELTNIFTTGQQQFYQPIEFLEHNNYNPVCQTCIAQSNNGMFPTMVWPLDFYIPDAGSSSSWY